MSETEIPPGTALITAIRSSRSTFYSWAGEAIDNALDAQAKTIRLIMNDTLLDAEDDGHGITKTRDDASVKIAQHGEMEGTRLGRFGVGIKYKSIQHGGMLHIVSISKDGKLTRRVDWDRMLTTGRWVYDDPVRINVAGQAMGTRITITRLSRKPTSADVARARTEIQRRYYPALEHGRVIELNGEIIKPIERPALDKMVDARLTFPHGRTARVRAGMLHDPASAKLRQVDICVAYRVIVSDCDFGCDGYSGIRAMYALIELHGNWKLTQFKDDIADDPYEDDLRREVQNVLRPILEQCQTASMFLKTKRLEKLINEFIPQEMRANRPQQKQRLNRKGPKTGKKKPNEAIGPDSKAGPTQQRKPTGIRIEFANMLCDEYGFGRALLGRAETRIQLAIDNPHIKELHDSRDEAISSIGLYAIATLLLHGQIQASEGQLTMMREPFGLRAWKVARQQTIPRRVAA